MSAHADRSYEALAEGSSLDAAFPAPTRSGRADNGAIYVPIGTALATDDAIRSDERATAAVVAAPAKSCASM